MRGFLQPSLRNEPTEAQTKFAALSRHRRVHLAEAAQTTLVKASQWSRGETVAANVSDALGKELATYLAKAAKKSG